jgi:hypothetical protein
LIPIAKASRAQHFWLANTIMGNDHGNSSPPNWTWHHLPKPYKMVLVDRDVHRKHGHNGGKLLWSQASRAVRPAPNPSLPLHTERRRLVLD